MMSGVNASGGRATASGQSKKPETEVTKGTVITVEFTYEDNIY